MNMTKVLYALISNRVIKPKLHFDSSSLVSLEFKFRLHFVPTGTNVDVNKDLKDRFLR